MSWLVISFSLMYSSKTITTFSASKLTEFRGGVALTKSGGMLSFAPPVGVPRLAQWVVETNQIITDIIPSVFRIAAK